jgi:hypothetical protein
MMCCAKTADDSRKKAQRTHRRSAPFCGTMCRRGALKTKPQYRVKAVGYSTDGESSTDHDLFLYKAR